MNAKYFAFFLGKNYLSISRTASILLVFLNYSYHKKGHLWDLRIAECSRLKGDTTVKPNPMMKFLLLTAGLAYGIYASARDPGLEFSHNSETRDLNGQFPVVLNKVVIKCPADGFLVTQADAQFTMGTGQAPFGGREDPEGISFSVSRDAPEEVVSPGHEIGTLDPEYVRTWSNPLLIFGASVDPYTLQAPGSIERVDDCTNGSTHVYRFVAFREGGKFAFNKASRSTLVVEYFRHRLGPTEDPNGE
jgi:hypothetical protein